MATNTNRNELSISKARRMLTELVNQAAYKDEEFTITRNGRPLARLVPLQDVSDDFDRLADSTITDSKDILRGLE